MKIKNFVLAGVMSGVMLMGTGCGFIKPFDTPEFVTIEASQTAFLIPMIGDTSDQASFQSEELLAQAKVATKEIQIPHRWVKTGRLPGTGEYRPTVKLIVVDRTPVTREWNSTKDSGTSNRNQAIYAESKESIGFSVGMNISAQIDSEDDAVKFLYSYNNKSLDQIMDSEIRARVESKFGEMTAKYSMENILIQKQEIMDAVRDDVMPYFSAKGITITVLGMKDGIDYDDPAIQKAINDKFSSAQKLVTQQNENEVKISKAEADAKAKITEAEADAKANRIISESLTDKLLEKEKIEKWSGNYPQVMGSGSMPIVKIGD